VSLQLVWQLEGFGLGNCARIKEQRGEESRAIVNLFKAQGLCGAEVTAAQARLPVGGGSASSRPTTLCARLSSPYDGKLRGPSADQTFRQRAD